MGDGPYHKFYFSFSLFFVFTILKLLSPELPYKTYSTPSASMIATIRIDDKIVVIKKTPAQKGDIVVFKYPNDESVSYVK